MKTNTNRNKVFSATERFFFIKNNNKNKFKLKPYYDNYIKEDYTLLINYKYKCYWKDILLKPKIYKVSVKVSVNLKR